jgi:small subunit ribosomal protein S8
MTVSDPIADMLTRIRNAMMAKHDSVLVPASRTKLAIARILKEEGFIADCELVKDRPHQSVRIRLKYQEGTPVISGMKRVSRPGLRVYVHKREIPRVYGGLGIAIISTPTGVRTGQQAWRQGSGGELLCYVW